MSYHPHFNPHFNSHFNPKPTSPFTPWCQSITSLFPPNLPTYPFQNTPRNPFPPNHPILIEQHNNFYNSNFSINEPLFNPLHKPRPSNNSSLQLFQPFTVRKNQPKPNKIAAKQIIEISDDDDCVIQVKSRTAVVKEKPPVSVCINKTMQNKLLQPKKTQKQVIQKKKVIQLNNSNQPQFKKQIQILKKSSRVQDMKKQPQSPSKKKKIHKQKFTYKLSEKEKALMRLSKYREYRPDLIMVGPQFQASIPDRPLFTQDRGEWVLKLRQNLMKNRQN